MINTHVVIGNGTSRIGIDLETLRGLGYLWGCNALYRDFKPDTLVAVDRGMIKEVVDSGYNGIFVLRHLNQLFRKTSPLMPSKVLGVRDKGWSCGSTAVYLACVGEARVVYLVGFDLVGTPENKHNNVYAGTSNYRGKDEIPTIHTNFVNQLSELMSEYQHVDFIRVCNGITYQPVEWTSKHNYKIVEHSSLIGGYRK